MNVFVRRTSILCSMSAIVGGVMTCHPAAAQDASQIRSIQQQIQSLQSQLRQLQQQSTQRDAALKQAQEEAARARAEAAQAQKAAAAPPVVAAPPPGTLAVTVPNYNPDKPNGSFSLGGVTVTLGGFFAGEGLYRTRNQTRSLISSFNSIPFKGPTPGGDTSELVGSAQQSRLSLKVQGKPSTASTLTGYVEVDFLNGAGNANSVQSSSYTPRLRQAFAQYQNDAWESYLLAGQAWNLATPFKTGLDPFATWQPLTIEAAYVQGYTYLRNPVLRVVKGFDNKYWLGLELDQPQTIFGGSSLAPTNGVIVTTLPGNGGLNPQQNYSLNSAPDIIGKFAADTPFGHYELFGLARWFKDQVSVGIGGKTETSFGGGIGGSMYVPITRYFDLAGDILYGYGVGRYGASGLPDVTFKSDGSLAPLREVIGLVGGIVHATPKVDVYGYAGVEQIGSKFFNTGRGASAKAFGYGNPQFDNRGCFIEDAPSTLACTGNNYETSGLTLGYWWKVYSGSYGTLRTGLQYAYNVRDGYRGKGGVPTAYENTIYASLRYYPFE
jgi:hypothetical protein